MRGHSVCNFFYTIQNMFIVTVEFSKYSFSLFKGRINQNKFSLALTQNEMCDEAICAFNIKKLMAIL